MCRKLRNNCIIIKKIKREIECICSPPTSRSRMKRSCFHRPSKFRVRDDAFLRRCGISPPGVQRAPSSRPADYHQSPVSNRAGSYARVRQFLSLYFFFFFFHFAQCPPIDACSRSSSVCWRFFRAESTVSSRTPPTSRNKSRQRTRWRNWWKCSPNRARSSG